MREVIGQIQSCQICESPNLKLILALGHHPPVHGHLDKKTVNEAEVKYPLNLVKCSDCHLVQSDYAVEPKIVFDDDYPYHTGTTNMLVRSFRELAEDAVRDYDLTDNDLVIDIGSNDGTLLQGFKDLGMKVLGIEPTNVALLARGRGIPTMKKFFGHDTAKEVVREYGKAKVVTGTNMFAHVNKIGDFLLGIKELLTPDGIFISESQYLLDVLEKVEVDTIYDEHLRYYSLKPMVKLFELAGFSLVDAIRVPSAGGSIRVFAKVGTHPTSDRAKDLILDEENKGVYGSKIYEKFRRDALTAKYDLQAILANLKRKGKSIAALGAPGRANTLLNFMNIDNDTIDYAGERNTSPKIGLFTPGTHIPILDEIKIIEEQPDYLLVLSWHIGYELMRKTRNLGYKGSFIMPLAKARIVSEI